MQKKNIYKHVSQPFLVRKAACMRGTNLMLFSTPTIPPGLLANKRGLCGGGCSTHTLAVKPTKMRVSKTPQGPQRHSSIVHDKCAHSLQ